MKTYRCVYENDVEADSPEEAAIECYRLMQEALGGFRPIISVGESPDSLIEIDTDELEFTL
jgi:hypothetical protein